MKMEILMIGKIQEKAYRSLVGEYIGRCGSRLSVDLIHCRDEQEMEKRAGGREWLVALDEHGKTFDSMAFSRWLADLMRRGLNRVTVCLGGAAGLTPALKQAANEKLAVSSLTLNHQLALLVFAEQAYRGLSILFGEPYHKA